MKAKISFIIEIDDENFYLCGENCSGAPWPTDRPAICSMFVRGISIINLDGIRRFERCADCRDKTGER